MTKLTVYFYEHDDDDDNRNRDKRSKRMAALETIKRIRGAPVMETAREIEVSALDQYGFYIPPKE